MKTRRYFRIGATIIVVSVCLPSESGLGGRRGRGGGGKGGGHWGVCDGNPAHGNPGPHNDAMMAVHGS